MQSKLIKVGHRGAPREFPANTMKSFQKAVAMGCDMIECDLQLSADSVIVLAHDSQIRDTNGVCYEINQCESEQLAKLDLGAKEGVPTFSELLDWAKNRCSIMADMKCEGGGVERKVIDSLSTLPSHQKTVPGASLKSRNLFREIDPGLPLSLSLGPPDELNDTQFEETLVSLDTRIITWHFSLLNEERIVRLHETGIQVFTWTVDDLDTMIRMKKYGGRWDHIKRPRTAWQSSETSAQRLKLQFYSRTRLFSRAEDQFSLFEVQ